jgi:hypothetical protein
MPLPRRGPMTRTAIRGGLPSVGVPLAWGSAQSVMIPVSGSMATWALNPS